MIRRLIKLFRSEEKVLQPFAYRPGYVWVRIVTRREILGWSWRVETWGGRVIEKGNAFTNSDAFSIAARWANTVAFNIARGAISEEINFV